GVSPFPAPARCRTELGCPSRLGVGALRTTIVSDDQEADPGDPKVTQAHREREQAQGTLGTADHSTRAPETGQNRVPCGRTQCSNRPPELTTTGNNEAPAGSLPGLRSATPGAPTATRTLPRFGRFRGGPR